MTSVRDDTSDATELAVAAEPTVTAEVAEVTATFDQVFEQEYPKVARLAFLLLGRTGEAEEVAQEAFVSLLQRWESIENPAGFLRTAVVNRCRDIGRRRGTRDRVLRAVQSSSTERATGADPSGSDGPGPGPGEHDELLDALRQLDEPLRELVVLRYYLDHTVPEIAALLGIPQGTVKSRLHRAVAGLAQAMGAEG